MPSPRPGLFCALIHPGTDESHLLGGQRFGRRSHPSWSTRSTGSGPSWRSAWLAGLPRCLAIARSAATRPSRTAAAGLHLRWHRFLFIEAGHRYHERAFLAFSRHDHFAFFAALQYPFQTIKMQARFRPLSAVTPNTGSFKQWANVFGISHPGLFGCRRKLAEVNIRTKRKRSSYEEKYEHAFHEWFWPVNQS